MKHYAIIDLGTNTFHLLIIGVSNKTFTEIYRERIQVYLAEDGILNIGEKAFKRALSALEHFSKKIQEYDIHNVRAIATAGFRKADNGIVLQNQIFESTGIKIEVISGDREAELIFKGVQLSIPLISSKDYLIMDIGGGSVEFIIVHNQKAVWAKSFEIGVAILYHLFNQEDPIPESSKLALDKFLEDQLQPLLNTLRNYTISGLLGASGSFEVLEGMVEDKEIFSTYSLLEVSHFNKLCELIIQLSYEERLALDKLPANRANLVVSAFLLMRFVLDKSKAPFIYVSKYALKEGMISEMFLE